ncbi:hypothetical protein CBS147333_9859 [Penicillium roqueforti]|nr:hypothetical protein CBS147333_9859 [Penicillium roqueforti]KAI3261765.1 hypothetical protein CBS147308_9661 [Penicillium roqueforti]KAI3279478.1 hypothetical protein DTO003C3_9772 [Penicillium roqueforti]
MSFSQSSSVTPAPLDSAWPPPHIWETMGAADRASWLGQIRRDRARRLEMDVAETDLRHRRPRVDLQGDENLEENREPPPEVKPLIDIFPGVSAALLTRVFERKLKVTELIRFKEKSVTEQEGQEDRVFKMTESGGTVGFRKAAASLKDWGPNPQTWTSCFLTYLAVIGYLFGEKHPKAVPNLLMFMRQILDLAQTYQWSEAVLPLALNFHQYILDKAELSTENNLVTAPFREKYLRHNLTLPANSPANPSARPRQTRSTRSSNNETEGQPPRPNTAIQYPVFKPELPKLQFSPSPLYAKGWSNLLRYYPGDLRSTITGILTYGVQLGYRDKKQFYHSSNHHIHEPEMISAKLADDLNLGRIRLACTPSFVSPLGLVPKHDGGWRRIHGLSWPPGQGLNQGIPDSWSAIEYITIDDIYEQATQAGPVPVAEDNQHLLAFQWNDSTYVECCLPFGLATAPFIFNLFAEALHWILQCLLPIFYINHYLDDFIAITRSSSLSDLMGSFDEVYNGVTDYLRIPRNTKKDQQGTCVTVLGIQIDSIAIEARLPPDKLCRATLDAAAALSAASLSLKQTERLTGSLAFCSRVVRLGGQGYSLYTPSKPPSHMGGARAAVSPTSNAASLALAQDAHAHQVAHAHINTTEVDAILQSILLFSHRWLHHTLVIHTDSSTAYTGLSKGFLHGPPNVPLKSLHIRAAARDIQIVPHWLPSGENTLADALSRPLGAEPPAWFSSRAPQINAGHLKLLWSGLSANTRSVHHSVQRNYEKHCATKFLGLASLNTVVNLLANFTTPWEFKPKGRQARHRTR